MGQRIYARIEPSEESFLALETGNVKEECVTLQISTPGQSAAILLPWRYAQSLHALLGQAIEDC